MSNETTTQAPAPVQYSQLPVGSKTFRVTTKVRPARKTKDGKTSPEKKYVIFVPAGPDEAKELLSTLIDQVIANNKDPEAVQKFVADILDDRCEDATNATVVKQPDGSYVKKAENYVPELVNVARATRAGGEKIKDIKERLNQIMSDSLDLIEFRNKNNTDALIAANSPKNEAGKPVYVSLAQVNTVLATWTMERNALRAKVAEHEHKLAESQAKREKKAAEKAAEAKAAPAADAKA